MSLKEVASARVVTAWISGDEWWPASRGRSWTFELPTPQIVDVLEAVAAKRGDSFTLLQCDRIDVQRESRSIYSELPLDALSIDGTWQYFIRSRTLTPDLPACAPRRGVGWPAEFSMNGLIGLAHPDPLSRLHNTQHASNLGVMHRIGRAGSHDLREHTAADALFKTLKRAFRASGATPL